jgi:hypothetical protein
MLLIQPSWEDRQPARRLLVSPFQPVRCVAVSSESPCFLVQPRIGGRNDDGLEVHAYLVATPEDLLDVIADMDVEHTFIYKIRAQVDAADARPLDLISAISSYRNGKMKWFAYANREGSVMPCLPWQPSPDDESELTIEWQAKQ